MHNKKEKNDNLGNHILWRSRGFYFEDYETQKYEYKEQLVSEFPGSDYASYLILQQHDHAKITRPIESIYAKAELLWPDNPIAAMEYYKDVIATDSLSELSASAAFFLGYQYDNTFTISKPESTTEFFYGDRNQVRKSSVERALLGTINIIEKM